MSLRDCIDAKKLPFAFVTACQNFSYGAVSIARAHHVLNELSNYRNGDDMNACAFHRILGDIHDIDVQYGEIMLDKAPSNPFPWVASWSKLDPSRAPEGKHILIIDTIGVG